MKLSISNIAWNNSEEEYIASLMQQIGIKGIEIAPSKILPNFAKLKNVDIIKYKDFWQNKGVEIVAMQSLLYGHPEMKIFYDKTTRENTLEHLKLCVDIGEKLGAKALVFGSPKNRYIPDNSIDFEDTAIEFFDLIGTYCYEKGIVFCMEPNPKEYGANFICNTEEALDFVKTVNNEGLKMNIDTGTIIANNEDYKRFLKEALAYAGHIHISEPFLNPIDPNRIIYKELADILRRFNYSKNISIEMKPLSENDNAENVRNTLISMSQLYI